MYSRNYYDVKRTGMNLPENYVGTAFSDNENGESATSRTESVDAPTEITDTECSVRVRDERPSLLSGLFGPDSPAFLRNIKIPEIGLEEILIIATAAFLFMSKDGDRECAVMLLLLLLVN